MGMAPRKQLSDEVASYLRERIVAGELAPGTSVRAEAVGELLSVSATPVREALHTLKVEGFLELIPAEDSLSRHCAPRILETSSKHTPSSQVNLQLVRQQISARKNSRPSSRSTTKCWRPHVKTILTSWSKRTTSFIGSSISWQILSASSGRSTLSYDTCPGFLRPDSGMARHDDSRSYGDHGSHDRRRSRSRAPDHGPAHSKLR